MKRATRMLILAGLCFSSLPAAAAELTDSMFAVAPAPVAVQPRAAAVALDYGITKRPAILPALYASFGALQALDVYTTSAALRSGAREADPVMGGLTGRQAQTIALKAATTAGTIFFVERLWKQNRVAAVVVLAVINGATTAVAMNNARNARRGR
jgi:hypothetical protein